MAIERLHFSSMLFMMMIHVGAYSEMVEVSRLPRRVRRSRPDIEVEV